MTRTGTNGENESGLAVIALIGSDQDVYHAGWEWTGKGWLVRVVRGRKMRTRQALFNEVSAALQFPSYFGENWDAFQECLSDLEWLSGGDRLFIVVVDPQDVLADDADELSVLARCVEAAADVWRSPIAEGEWWDREPVGMDWVFAGDAGSVQLASARWRAVQGRVRGHDQ